jgi:hypothetical protein
VSKRKLNFSLQGGQAYNVVNDLVTYQGPLIKEVQAILKEHQIQTSVEDKTLTVYGQAAHGSLPFLGVNAAT